MSQVAKTSAPTLPEHAGWYLFQQEIVHGPFTRDQLVALILNRRVDGVALLMREDWGEWRPLVDCLDDLSNDESARKAKEARAAERRIGAPRIAFTASITAKSPAQQTLARAKDISVSGIFIQTPATPFRLGEHVEIHVASPDLREPFQAKAEVMRFNANRRFDVGYGLRFVGLDNKVVAEIARLVGYRPISEFGDVAVTDPFQVPGKK